MTRAQMKRTLTHKEFLRYQYYRDMRIKALVKDGKISSTHVEW